MTMKSPDVIKMQPECPYCGEPMEPSVECSICRLPVTHPDYWPCAPEWNYRVSFVCRACSTRTSNTLHSPVEHAETEEEALAKAYLSATKKQEEYETNMHHLIRQLEAQVPRWISVEERLPENKQIVIGYTPCDGYMFVGYYREEKNWKQWYIVTAMRSTKYMTKKVTHWMPLPEAPKEG